MVIYVEYVLIENFIIDYTLLALSLRSAKVPLNKKAIALAASLGAVFACIFPLLGVSGIMGTAVKIGAGFLLCACALYNVKPKKQRGRYALTCCFFFTFSFAFGGSVLAVYNAFSFQNGTYVTTQAPVSLLLCCGIAFCWFSARMVRALYKKREQARHLYDCTIACQHTRVAVTGFLDSGNRADYHGHPVCFIAPDTAYDVWHETLFSASAIKDTLTISTVAGEKSMPLHRATLEIHINGKHFLCKDVYFAITKNILSQEYKILLSARILDCAQEVETT